MNITGTLHRLCFVAGSVILLHNYLITAAPAPAVAFPTEGATVSGTIVLQASVTNAESTTKVKFVLNDTLVIADNVASPFSFKWDSKKVSDGSHRVTVSIAGSSTSATASTSFRIKNLILPKIVLPVEVIGANGATQTVQFDLDNAASLSSPMLRVKLHGLYREDVASIQVNNSPWLPVNAATFRLLGDAVAHGGIGGGMHTIEMETSINTYLLSGVNSLRFRFVQVPGNRSIGFRVLELNIRSNDMNVIPATQFVQDNPLVWPIPNSSAISEGKRLWEVSTVYFPGTTNKMRAKCGDCHAKDGRDLQYFNYSNRSIRERAVFHGITPTRGDYIASYIRSLNVPRPGRPWNPPYQPGPALDSKSVSEWSAGAGLSAVLPDDASVASGLFPSGIQPSVFQPTGDLNPRNIAIPIQLPDWNRWLPEIHPVDVMGDTFSTSAYYQTYLTLRSQLRVRDGDTYAKMYQSFLDWTIARDKFMALVRPANSAPLSAWTLQISQNTHGSSLWQVVKMWELNQEFELEGLNRYIFKHPEAEPRGWAGNTLFRTSPTLLAIPDQYFLNGTLAAKTYLNFGWYHLQLITNDSNHQQEDGSPIDWPYSFGAAQSLCTKSLVPSPLTYMIWQIRALQISENGKGPEFGKFGWNWNTNDPSRLVSNTNACWANISSTDRVQINEAFLRAWLTKLKTFTPQQLYAYGVSPNESPTMKSGGTKFAERVSFMLPNFRAIGVSPALIQEAAAWAKTIWPGADWDKIANAPCILDYSRNEYKCSL